MKKLSEVTLEDATAILYDAYGQFWLTHPKSWKLEDRTEAIQEPCKFLSAKGKIWQFWFFDDKIDIEKVPDDDTKMELVTLEDFCDVKLSCYLKAHELGYYVPKMSAIWRFCLRDCLVHTLSISTRVGSQKRRYKSYWICTKKLVT